MIVYCVKSIRWHCLCNHSFGTRGLGIASLIKKKILNKRKKYKYAHVQGALIRKSYQFQCLLPPPHVQGKGRGVGGKNVLEGRLALRGRFPELERA